MGDGDHRPRSQDGLQVAQQRRLGLDIEVRRGLVEDQDRRIGQDGAGDGEALALPAAQPDPVLADPGVVARRQGRDGVVDAGAATGVDHPIVVEIGVGQSQVVADRGVEQVDVLGHHAEERPRVVAAIGVQVVPAEADRAASRTSRTAAGG